ncbi:NAD-dependent protein deacylase [Paenibacillus marinisediminis]
MNDSSLEAQAIKLARDLLHSERIVFFGGAGTSTESGIPDFRSAGGVFDKESKYPYPPEEMVSRPYFYEDPKGFYTFYRDKLLHPHAQPNGCHRALAKLEQEGSLKAVITQNIDGLHQAAGSREVLELHGTVHRNYCLSCGAEYDLTAVLNSDAEVPRCPACDGILKPDVVLYGESLHDDVIERAVDHVRAADLLIVAGTSLSVQPAASFVQLRRPTSKLVLINRTATAIDRHADAVYREPVGQLLEEACRFMFKLQQDE